MKKMLVICFMVLSLVMGGTAIAQNQNGQGTGPGNPGVDGYLGNQGNDKLVGNAGGKGDSDSDYGLFKAKAEATTFGAQYGQWLGFETYNVGFAKSKGIGIAYAKAGSEFCVWGFSTGRTISIGLGNAQGGSFGIAGISSDAGGEAGILGIGKVEAGGLVFGNVYQASESYTVALGWDGFSEGHGYQKSGGAYIGHNDSERCGCFVCTRDGVNGSALGVGFTKEYTHVGYNHVAAKTMVGNLSFARTDGIAVAYGKGFTEHNQFTGERDGYVGTSAKAGYEYIATGRNAAIGGGFAMTQGNAYYNSTPNTMNAHAEASSVSITGGIGSIGR